MKILWLLLVGSLALGAQTTFTNLKVGDSATILPSSLVEFKSTTKGFLMPRMTTTQKNAIASPATGLLVYDTTALTVFQWNGSAWTSIGGGGGSVTSVTASLPLSSSGGTTPNISITQSNGSTDGYLSSVDWNTFNNKQDTISIGAIDSQSPNADGLSFVSNVLSTQSADTSNPGMVNNTTQSFSGNKTFTGSISASNLSGSNTGDVTLTTIGATPNANGLSLSGQQLRLQPASATFGGAVTTGTQTIAGLKTFSTAIATSLTNPASAGNIRLANGNTIRWRNGTNTGDATFQYTSGDFFAMNAPLTVAQTLGLQDGALNGVISLTAPATAVDFSFIFPANMGTNGYVLSTDGTSTTSWVAPGINQLTGDGTAGPGSGSQVFTLATVNGNVGSFGSSTSIPSFTVNAKGLITAASGNVVIAPAGTLTGTTLASNVVTSSLTSVGTITTGVWNGTTIAIANGGTGQTTKAAAFDALSPMTTQYDLIYGGASGTGTRLAKGANNTHLTTQAGVVAWTSDPSPYSVSSINSNTSAVNGTTYLCDTSGGAFTVTLPAPVLNAFVTIKDKTGSFQTNNLTVAPNGAEKIEGLAASKILQTNWGSMTFFSDGTDWYGI